MKRWLAIAALCAAPALGARELHWRDFAVHARLDAQGRLHVEETQVMVFTGDWNGGYREFRLAPGQKLELEGLQRVDEPTGRRIPLVEGDISLVDHYEWSDAKTVRWRSRLPFDPAFDNTAITYVLTYTLSNILGRSGDTYVLDHDFAFPNRAGVIERFTLALDLDPPWQPPAGFATHLERQNVPSGSGVVLREDLRFRGPGPAPAAPRTFTGKDRRVILAAIAGLFLLLLIRLHWWESASGRYRGLLPPSAITREWLKENLFVWKPEEAGAAWDDAIGAPEVAATLARLVAEGKLESRIETKDELLGSKGHVLHLRLKTPRDQFAAGYERDLIEKIFVEGEEMDTETLRKHYASTGFDPSKILTDPLQKRIAAGTGAPRTTPVWEKFPAWLLTLAGLGLAVWTFAESPARGLVVAGIVAFAFAGIAGAVAGAAVSAAWKKHYGPSTDALLPLFLIPPLFFLAPAVLLDFARRARFDAFADVPERMVLALLCLGLGAMIGTVLSARTTDPPGLLERRRRLASARQFFEAELGKREPALVDAWYPYLVAFGLDKQVAGWFHAYGASTSGTSFSGTGSSTSVSSSSWSGGGGAFGGAGASVGWAAAAAGIAGGVAAPSSSSGGGGGGGGSSGGGGGGGW